MAADQFIKQTHNVAVWTLNSGEPVALKVEAVDVAMAVLLLVVENLHSRRRSVRRLRQ